MKLEQELEDFRKQAYETRKESKAHEGYYEGVIQTIDIIKNFKDMKTSKVSRSVYQKMVEENKRLMNDIKTLVYGDIPTIIFLKEKYRKKFESEKEFNQMLIDVSKMYMDNNPNDPIVKAVKEFRSLSDR